MTEDNQQYSLGGFGARLKIAREALQFSQKDVAMRLHLSPHIIQIIESEDLRQAPPATFMRGYLRSYAKLLNVDDTEINQALTHSGLDLPPKTTVAPMLLQADAFPHSDRYVHWVTMLVLAISLVLVSIWWNSHSHDTSSYATRSALQNPAVPSTTNTVEVTQQPAAIASTTPTSTAPSSATQPPVAATTPTSAAPQSVATQAAGPVNTLPAATPVANSTGSVAVVTPTNPAATSAPTTMAGAQPVPAPTNATPVAPITPTTTPPLAIMPPLAAASSTQQNVAQTVDSEPHRKHHRHSQDNNVSGMAMALPEPGLE